MLCLHIVNEKDETKNRVNILILHCNIMSSLYELKLFSFTVVLNVKMLIFKIKR